MKLIKSIKIRHLIDDSWVCEYNYGSRFNTRWEGVSAGVVDDKLMITHYPEGTMEYYNHCRGNYEEAVQTQLKLLTMHGMGMDD